jgi:hypothetical protein
MAQQTKSAGCNRKKKRKELGTLHIFTTHLMNGSEETRDVYKKEIEASSASPSGWVGWVRVCMQDIFVAAGVATW